MDVFELTYVIEQIKSDPIHLTDRRVLHENYEWLEHYWRHKYKSGNNSLNDFIKDKGAYFWNLPTIQYLAKQYASLECVGSNDTLNYVQTIEIAKATMYLRYHCSLFGKDIPNCQNIGCRNHKTSQNICIESTGRYWKGNFDPIFAFKALMYILRQIRNNLFHGNKLTLEPEQYNRDKQLVSLSAQLTTNILDNLVSSGI